MSQESTQEIAQGTPAYVGLAPFLRRSITGDDLRPIAQALLDQANANPEDADSLLNLALVLQCVGSRDAGLSLLGEALNMKTTYSLPARRQPSRCRLLMLMAPGDISTNTPLDCLLEESDIDLIQHYMHPSFPSLEGLPEHDAIFVAISEGGLYNPLLDWLAQALADSAKPVLNRPAQIARLARDNVSAALRDAPGLFIPETVRLGRAALQRLVTAQTSLADLAPSLRLPVILRPLGSQGGRDLEKIESLEELAAYLARVQAKEFYLANFIDYRGADGLYRKMRIVLVDGQPFVAHVGISDHWMIHYVNAGMYDDAAKREQEAAFMANFEDFAQRHAAALGEIHRRSGLDYLCIDCAETPDGQLFVFEIGNDMVVHAMDPVALFPYKPPVIARIVDAFRNLLLGRIG